MGGHSRIKLIINAIPLLNIGTGIGTYIQCTYAALEDRFRHKIQFGYFDGLRVSDYRPRGPSDLSQWSSHVDLFWKLPAFPALALRILSHWQRELCFRRAAKGYDIYHEAAFFPFVPPRPVKTVFTLHDLSLIRFPQFHPRERVLFARIFMRRRCSLVDQFLTDSHFIKREIEHYLHIDADKIKVVPLAHDSTIFYPRDSSDVDETKRRYALPDKYFIAVGSGDPRKNMGIIPLALEAADTDIPLVVAGWSGWTQKSIKLKHVSALGYVANEDLARLYSGAIALVYPSLYEGFGLPILEAMACGCPVICSREASIPEVAGEAALYLKDPKDSLELGSLLRKIASDKTLREQLSQFGIDRASRFSWEKTAQQTFSAFKELM